MTLTYGFSGARDILEKARRDYARLLAASASRSENALPDALFDFAVTVFHVRDWLKHHPTAGFTPQDVETFVRSSTALSAFHDLCTASKHKQITLYRPTTFEVVASAVAPTSTVLGDGAPEAVHKAFVTKVVKADASRHEALALAAQAIADWDAFFNEHDIQ